MATSRRFPAKGQWKGLAMGLPRSWKREPNTWTTGEEPGWSRALFPKGGCLCEEIVHQSSHKKTQQRSVSASPWHWGKWIG